MPRLAPKERNIVRLRTAMERSQQHYQEAKAAYDRVIKELPKESLATGEARRAILTYSSCLAAYTQATTDFNNQLLEDAFPEARAANA